MGTRIGDGNGDRNKRRDGNLMGTGTRMGMGMEKGKGQKGKGSSLLPAFPPAAGSASSGNEQLSCPRLPRLGGEGFSSAEGLRVRHQKADGKEQVIFFYLHELSTAISVGKPMDYPAVCFVLPHPVSHKRDGETWRSWAVLMGHVGSDRNQVWLYLISAGGKKKNHIF